MPYPSLFIILSFIWGFTILVWCFNWIRFRSQPSRLNRLMTVLPIIKFIYCGIGILYWKTESVIGEVPNNIEYTFIFFIILEEAIFFLILMTIASGWGVSKDHFGSEKFIILGIIVALMGTRILGYFIHQLFFLLSFLAGLIIVVLIFRFVNLNLRALQLQMRENPTPITNDGTLRNPMAEKNKKLKAFKVIMLAFIAFLMIIFLFQLLFLREYPWSTDMLRELLDLMVFICVSFTFRLQDFTVYYILEEDEVEFNHPVNNGAMTFGPSVN